MKDILEIIGEYGIEVVKEGEILRAFCPFHNDSGRPNFTVYKETDSWFCFACNFGGDAIDFVSKFEGISKRAAMAKLRGAIDDFTEMGEMADGIGVPDGPEMRNNECDFAVSYCARLALQQNPKNAQAILQFLKEFDQRSNSPITFEDEQEILKTFKQKFPNCDII